MYTSSFTPTSLQCVSQLRQEPHNKEYYTTVSSDQGLELDKIHSTCAHIHYNITGTSTSQVLQSFHTISPPVLFLNLTGLSSRGSHLISIAGPLMCVCLCSSPYWRWCLITLCDVCGVVCDGVWLPADTDWQPQLNAECGEVEPGLKFRLKSLTWSPHRNIVCSNFCTNSSASDCSCTAGSLLKSEWAVFTAAVFLSLMVVSPVQLPNYFY